MPIEIKKPSVLGQRYGGYIASFGPFVESARTAREARDMVISKADAAISGDFNPEILTYAGSIVVVYRNPHGWAYLYRDKVGEHPTANVFAGTYDRDAAIRSAKLYLVQSVYPGQNGLDFLTGDQDAIQSHCHWLCFQRAYESAWKNGTFTESECHAIAGRESEQVSRWLTVEERATLEKVTEP